MLTYTYVSKGTFALMEKPKPVLQHERDAIVKVTLASICSSDLHIKHGSVPRAVPGITVGHEMVGIVEEVGSAVTNVKPGGRPAFRVSGQAEAVLKKIIPASRLWLSLSDDYPLAQAVVIIESC